MTDLHPGSFAVLAAILYLSGFVTAWILAKRRTRHGVMRELCADPATLRALAQQVEDARFRAAAADAERRVGGLLHPEQ